MFDSSRAGEVGAGSEHVAAGPDAGRAALGAPAAAALAAAAPTFRALLAHPDLHKRLHSGRQEN